MDLVKFSIVICTYNRESFLPGLFDSIVKQSLEKSLYEIVLINNNSTDSTENICLDFIRMHPDLNISYYLEREQGLSYARNRGIAESKGGYITFADDDALLDERFAEKACRYLDSHPETDELGGPIYLQYMGKIPAWENPWMNSLLGYFNPSGRPYRMKIKNKRYPRGSNMTFRKETFNNNGNFNVTLGRIGRTMIGGEEKDIAYRILDHGGKIDYQPDIKVYHLVPEERTVPSFIKRQALGTGKSERLRSSLPGNSYSSCIFKEIIKWGATLILWFRYMLALKPAKANMLVRFRWWVSKGILNLEQNPEKEP